MNKVVEQQENESERSTGDNAKIDFSPGSDLGKLIDSWAKRLDGNRGERAAIRRCRDADEVVLQPAFMRYYTQVVKQKNAGLQARSMAAVLGLVAHLETDKEGELVGVKQSLAVQFASPTGGSDSAPLIHPLRFQRLLQCDREQLYPALRRMIMHCKRRVNPYDLANSVFYWGPKMKFSWAYDYYDRAQLDKKS